MARSTFYRHYASLDALSDDIVDEAITSLSPPAHPNCPDDIQTRLIAHIQQHRPLAAALFAGPHAAPLVERFTRQLSGQLQQAFEADDSRPGTADLDATMLSHATVAGVRFWLQNPRLDSDVLLARLHACRAALRTHKRFS